MQQHNLFLPVEVTYYTVTVLFQKNTASVIVLDYNLNLRNVCNHLWRLVDLYAKYIIDVCSVKNININGFGHNPL